MSDEFPSATPDGDRLDEPAVDTADVLSDGPATDDDAPQEMSPWQLAETRQYGRRRLACRLIDSAVELAFLAVWAFVVARPVDLWLQGTLPFDFIGSRLGCFFLISAAAGMLVNLPLAFYRGHLLEHRYRLSRQTAAGWLSRFLKRQLLMAVFGLAMVEALYGIIWLTGGFWWLVAAIGFFIVGVVVGQLAPVLLLPLFYRIERIDDEQLAERFERLAQGTGLSIEGIYRMEMSAETTKGQRDAGWFGTYAAGDPRRYPARQPQRRGDRSRAGA